MEKIKIILISSLFIFTFSEMFALVAGAEATNYLASSGITDAEAASVHTQSLLSAW